MGWGLQVEKENGRRVGDIVSLGSDFIGVVGVVVGFDSIGVGVVVGVVVGSDFIGVGVVVGGGVVGGVGVGVGDERDILPAGTFLAVLGTSFLADIVEGGTTFLAVLMGCTC